MSALLDPARLPPAPGRRRPGHAVYGFPGAPACVTDTVDTYLTEGRLPTRDTACRAQP